MLLNELSHEKSLHGYLRPMETSIAVHVLRVDEESKLGR